MKEEKLCVSSESLFSAMDELLAKNRQAVFTVTGMSMWPFLCHGRDQVILEKCDFAHLKKGDVVLFRTPLGNYMLHRITRLESEYFETTGDGNCIRDGRFPISCIIARAAVFIRKEEIISCDSVLWQSVFRIWGLMFPIRLYLLKILTVISRIKSFVQ